MCVDVDVDVDVDVCGWAISCSQFPLTCPSLAANVPAAQAEQTEEPLSEEYLPVPQSVQDSLEAEDFLPGEQEAHSEKPTSANFPSPQLKQSSF